jgi:hypothetical protein
MALGVDLGSISLGFGHHFGSSWLSKIGKKGDPDSQPKPMEQKRRRPFRVSLRKGGALKLVNSILQGTPLDPLSLHFVPQGHRGGYICDRIFDKNIHKQARRTVPLLLCVSGMFTTLAMSDNLKCLQSGSFQTTAGTSSSLFLVF